MYKIFILIFCINLGYAQEFRFGIGYGMYSMGDLITLQKNSINTIDIDVPLKIVDDFPGNIFYETQLLGYLNEKDLLGGFINFTSTGGRIHYEDYSGEYKINQVITGLGLGIIYEKNLNKKNNIFISLKGSTIFTKLINKETLRIADNEVDKEFTFEAIVIGLEANLTWKFNFFTVPLLAYAGAIFTIPSDFTLEDNDKVFLVDGDDHVTPGWDGFKFGFLINLNLSKE